MLRTFTVIDAQLKRSAFVARRAQVNAENALMLVGDAQDIDAVLHIFPHGAWIGCDCLHSACGFPERGVRASIVTAVVLPGLVAAGFALGVNWQMPYSVLAGLFISALAYRSANRIATRPLSMLAGSVERMGGGGSISRMATPEAGVAEIIRLTEGVNQLIDRMDIERSLAERREESLRLAAKLFDNSADGVVITDANNRIVAANPAFLAMTGCTFDDIKQKSPSVFASGKHSKEFYQAMWESISSDGKWSGLIWDRRHDGQIYEKHLSIEAIRDDAGKVVNYISIHSDNTSRKEAQESIHFLAYYDTLTGLPNRSLLKDRLEQSIALAKRSNSELSVLFLDLDRFKVINDTMGHAAGDKLLRLVAKRIKERVREVDTISRIGGDEFVVVLQGSGKHGAAKVAANIIDAVMMPYTINNQQVVSKTSIGIAVFPQDGMDIDSLIKNADMAMYQAKKLGRNNFQFFDIEMDSHANNIFSTEKDIRAGIERGEFYVEFQPQVNCQTGLPCGAEALIRWKHPTRGKISPDEFVSIAEETGQIIQLGEWILQEACQSAKRWNDAGFPYTVSVNLSMSQLRHPYIVNMVRDALVSSGLPPHLLELELTEGVMMEDARAGIDILCQLRKLGLLLAIDDFGTGYSSLNYLKRMPVTQLKIDKSFVTDINSDDNDAAIVRSIVTLGHQFGLEVVAEGVETEQQHDLIKALGCDKLQGFYCSRPVSEQVLLEFFAGSKTELRGGGHADVG